MRAKELLLLLDNCEHLIDAAAHLVDALLARALRVRLQSPAEKGSPETLEAVHLEALQEPPERTIPRLDLPDEDLAAGTLRAEEPTPWQPQVILVLSSALFAALGYMYTEIWETWSDMNFANGTITPSNPNVLVSSVLLLFQAAPLVGGAALGMQKGRPRILICTLAVGLLAPAFRLLVGIFYRAFLRPPDSLGTWLELIFQYSLTTAGLFVTGALFLVYLRYNPLERRLRRRQPKTDIQETQQAGEQQKEASHHAVRAARLADTSLL